MYIASRPSQEFAKLPGSSHMQRTKAATGTFPDCAAWPRIMLLPRWAVRSQNAVMGVTKAGVGRQGSGRRLQVSGLRCEDLGLRRQERLSVQVEKSATKAHVNYATAVVHTRLKSEIYNLKSQIW